jgi:hypothetical protein
VVSFYGAVQAERGRWEIGPISSPYDKISYENFLKKETNKRLSNYRTASCRDMRMYILIYLCGNNSAFDWANFDTLWRIEMPFTFHTYTGVYYVDRITLTNGFNRAICFTRAAGNTFFCDCHYHNWVSCNIKN